MLKFVKKKRPISFNLFEKKNRNFDKTELTSAKNLLNAIDDLLDELNHEKRTVNSKIFIHQLYFYFFR